VLEEIPQYFDPLSIEREISVYWKENDIMQKSFERNRGKERFSFLEGPPTANGPPHVGHAETRAMKDLFLRYKTMKGFYINPRIAGWDCHGLPVEIEVEKSLGIKNKSEIEKMGIAKFNKLCKESVFKYVKQWEEVSNRLGYWVDYRNAYITMDDKYIESEWWALKELYNRGLLFKDFRISPYCPRCGTTLSTHEVAQGYREIEDYSIYVKFHVEGRDEYFVAWTTTPWTLPANEYLVVNPDLSYILVEHKGLKLWMAEERAPSIIKDYLVLERRSGKELIGTKYEQLIPFLKLKTGLYVVGGDFVTKDDGSGIVHAAPAFGADDYSVMKRENGELYITVNESGKISLESPWEGMDVQSASDEIIKYLKTSGKLLKTEKATHSYPFCWRCGTRLIYYPVESWFIGVSRARDKIVQLNKTINWKPDYIRDGRFGNFLDEGKDWALSRNRFWGTPLPVWTCKNGHIFVPGSKKELLDRSSSIPDDFDLHRPKVDEIQIRCKDCGEMMMREPYPIDTWFDSGSAFFAQFHYPFENQQAFFENHPVDFISEAIDQTRGWFYSLHVISSLVFGKPAFRNVVVMEFVLNSQGEKMSKSRGDKVNPIELIDKMGTDALRLFFFEGPPGNQRDFPKMLQWISPGNFWGQYTIRTSFSPRMQDWMDGLQGRKR
jgi:isoleucyl-tRNA synthetase